MEIIKDGLKEQFAKNIQLVIQQEGSILKNTITVGSQDTEIASFESMGTFEAHARTRHAIQVEGKDSLYGHYSELNDKGIFNRDAVGNKVDFYAAKISRRYLGAAAYHWSATMDRNDKLNLLADPTTHFPKLAGWAMGRQQDALIIKSFADPVKAGRTGTETINFDVKSNVVPLGLSFTVTGENKNKQQEFKDIEPANTKTIAALAHAEITWAQDDKSRIHSNSKLVASGGAGLTVQKLIRAKHILNKGLLGRPNKFYLLCSQQQITDLLKDTRIQSIDYNTVRALVAGEVNSFMGFTFVVSEMLGGIYDHEVVEGKRYAVRDCYAYTDTSIRFHTVNGSIEKEITKLIEYHNNYFMYYSEAFGAARDNEKSVVCIKCLEEYDASIHNADNPPWKATNNADHKRALHSTVVPWQMFGAECRTVDNQAPINDDALKAITEKKL